MWNSPTSQTISVNDTLNRLKTVSKSGEITTYTYDQSGNRLKEVTGTITKDYIYDSKNKLSQVTEKDNDIVTKITTYVYDLNGNLLTTSENGIIVETNVFNDRNELISTTKDNATTTYGYNVEGKRISKSDGADTTKFIYEGTKIILEVDGSNNELSRNIYGLALVSRTTGNNNGYYLYNGHADVVLIIDELNQTLNTYEYDAFGNITNETETLGNPYKYAGYYYDNETGNYYLMSRYYNPLIARFISEDTYRGELNDPLSLNRYVYVNNNPLIYYDPNGYFLKESLEWVGVRAVALVHGTAELAYDTAVGTFNLGWKTGEFIGSGIGLAGNYAAYQSGLTSEDTYNYLHDSYLKTFTKSGETLANLPENMVNGIVNNFKTTFNMDNLNAYLDSNASYDTIKNYSKSVIQTGLTVYGGAKMLQGAHNMVSQIGSSISYNPGPTLVTTEGFTFGTVGSFSIDMGAINQAIINGAKSIGINASLITGANSGGSNNYNAPKPDNPKFYDDKYLEKNGVNPHKLKKDTLGDTVRNSDYNIYVDKNGDMWLLKRGSKDYVPTYESINDYN